MLPPYRIKMCIGIPLKNAKSKSDVQWKMIDLGYAFNDYLECKNLVTRLEEINGTDGTAINFWISEN